MDKVKTTYIKYSYDIGGQLKKNGKNACPEKVEMKVRQREREKCI